MRNAARNAAATIAPYRDATAVHPRFGWNSEENFLAGIHEKGNGSYTYSRHSFNFVASYELPEPIFTDVYVFHCKKEADI